MGIWNSNLKTQFRQSFKLGWTNSMYIIYNNNNKICDDYSTNIGHVFDFHTVQKS